MTPHSLPPDSRGATVDALSPAAALQRLKDEVAALELAVRQARITLSEVLVKEAHHVHPEFVDRTVFPALDRAVTVGKVAEQYQSVLRGGR